VLIHGERHRVLERGLGNFRSALRRLDEAGPGDDGLRLTAAIVRSGSLAATMLKDEGGWPVSPPDHVPPPPRVRE
jgi:hypothetical protein